MAASLLLFIPASASSQAVELRGADAALTTMPVPGGTAALARLAGLDETTPRGIVLLQVVRVVHESPVGSDPARDERLERLRAYLADLANFLRARSVLRDFRVSAGLARSGESRRGMEDVVRAAGGELQEARGVYRLVLGEDDASRRRRRHLELAGLDLAALAQVFESGATMTLDVHADAVPLPLDAHAWERIVSPAQEWSGSLLTALLGDRRASLLYHGLLSLDRPTRAYIGANQTLLGKLADGNRPAILASLGRSIRVRNGAVDVAGGPAAVPLWEDLLQKRVKEPDAFILELLDRDSGRAALLYDAVDHLQPPQQAFALSLLDPDLRSRIDRLRALLAAFAPSLAHWDPDVRPFRRVTYDPVHVLTATHVQPSGELPPPAGRRFWNAVLSSSELPDEPGRVLRSDEADVPVDAAWIVGTICVENPAKRQQLLRTWLFGQRVFGSMPQAALPHALIALRGFARFPTLLQTLERLGISDPEVYASAVRHAQRLSDIGGRETADTALRQFQGALAVVERARFSRAISSEAALRLVRALFSVPIAERGEYLGGIGVWLDSQFLAATSAVSERDARRARTTVSAEASVLAALAGASARISMPEIEWEGLRYRVDIGAAAFARLVRVRQKQGGYDLDGVLELLREANRLDAAPGELAGAPALAARASAILAHPALSARSDGAGAELRDLLREAVDLLQKIRTPKDASKLTRVQRPLLRACDLLLAGILTSLAYAPHLGDPDGPELLAGDPAERHSFGFDERIAEARALNPWRLPQREYGRAGGWHVTGSVLALDVGLAPLALRRVASDGLPPPPSGNDIDRAAVAAAVVLRNPFALSDAGRDALVDALRRGRARLRGLAAHPAALPALIRAARVNDWLRQILPWAQEHEAARVPDYFSLGDIVRIGEAETLAAAPPDTWGAAWLDTEGCLCLRYPRAGLRETLAGRMGTALVTEQFVDLPLRVAESLADLGLPARLAPAVMAMAAQDILDGYRPAYIDDWTALDAAVGRLSEGRFVDYIATLTAGGPLVPDDRENTSDGRR